MHWRSSLPWAVQAEGGVEAALGESLLFLHEGTEPQAACDGVFETIPLPARADVVAERFNYEVHVRDAHWRSASDHWFVPAVRAPTDSDQDRYVHAGARHYQDWLLTLSRWSEFCVCDKDLDALVLIESWQGHALCWQEPEDPIQPPSPRPQVPVRCLRWGEPCPEHLALMVHGFYLDGLAEMLRDLPKAEIDLYVSTPHWQFSAMAALLRQQRWPRVRLFAVPNRGRDLAPFLLQLLPVARAAAHRSFIKLHTKSSPHLSEGQTGDTW